MLKEEVTMESESNGVHEPEEEVRSSVSIIVSESKAEPACGGRVSSLEMVVLMCQLTHRFMEGKMRMIM